MAGSQSPSSPMEFLLHWFRSLPDSDQMTISLLTTMGTPKRLFGGGGKEVADHYFADQAAFRDEFIRQIEEMSFVRFNVEKASMDHVVESSMASMLAGYFDLYFCNPLSSQEMKDHAAYMDRMFDALAKQNPLAKTALDRNRNDRPAREAREAANKASWMQLRAGELSTARIKEWGIRMRNEKDRTGV